MDLLMPKMDGIEATRQITAQQPHAHVLVLTSFVGDDKIFPAIKAGAMGYLLKDSDPAELIRSIYKVQRGRAPLHPEHCAQDDEGNPGTPHLEGNPGGADRQGSGSAAAAWRKALRMMKSPRRLTISEVTVRTHISHLLSKLHLANRVQATLYALREGITSIENEGE